MLERFLMRSKSEAGQGIIAVVVSVVIFIVASYFLYRTVRVANNINNLAGRIEEGAVSIDTSARSISELVQTEAILDSILNTSKPLVPSLNEIINVAASIDGTATSINSSILSINNNVQGIGREITDILSTTRQIAADITSINNLLDATIAVANNIKRDTGLIEPSLNSANVSVCGIGGIGAGVLLNSSPDETCLN
jgi:methyl-accepting chemotaxis protein